MFVTWCKFALSHNAFYCSWLRILDWDKRLDLQAGQAGCFAGELELDVHKTDSSLKALSTIHPVNTATTQSKNRPKPTSTYQGSLHLAWSNYWHYHYTMNLFLKLFSWYLVVWILISLTKLSPCFPRSPAPLNLFLSREEGGCWIPVSLLCSTWVCIDSVSCHSCYQQELA